jgi:hypothetical protein
MTERPNIHERWLALQAARAYKLRAVSPPEAPKVVEQTFTPTKSERDWKEGEIIIFGKKK